MSLPTWMLDAACQGMDRELFFPLSPVAEPDPQVKAACGSCPVRSECLDYAISVPEKYGTWGGLNETRRADERRRRSRRAAA